MVIAYLIWVHWVVFMRLNKKLEAALLCSFLEETRLRRKKISIICSSNMHGYIILLWGLGICKKYDLQFLLKKLMNFLLLTNSPILPLCQHL